MSSPLLVRSALALALLIAADVHAATDADLAEIRDQIRQLKESYEARIQALEQRLKDAEAKSAARARRRHPPRSPRRAVAPTPAVAAAGAVRAGVRHQRVQPGDLRGAAGCLRQLLAGPESLRDRRLRAERRHRPREARAFSIAESELGLSANVDDKFYGNLIFSLSPDNTVDVEEAYGLYTAAPYGIAPKFGRFLSSIGYLNDQHQHAWDFYDAPLVYQAFLGGQYQNNGLQVKWIAPTDEFLEFGAEIGSGESFPGNSRNKNGTGNGIVYVHAGGDVGASNSWRAGLSYLQTGAKDREYSQLDVAGNDAQLAFTGTSKLAIADFVWKWAPNGNAQERNFKLQGEYFWRRENGDLTYDADGALGLTQTGSYRSDQNGFYVQGVYQFMPTWRVGVRYDWLNPGSVDYGIERRVPRQARRSIRSAPR